MSSTPDSHTSVAISTYNASDMENFGDVLYPVLIQRFLERHAVARIDGKYAFLDGTAPLQGGYQVSAVRMLFGEHDLARDVRLLVGGGDILRSDDLTVARHYSPPETVFARTSFSDMFAGSVRALPTWEHQFVRERMPPHRGAFFVSPRTCHRLLGTAFVSCGVPFEIEPAQRPAVRAALDAASYVYVRDHQSREKLLRAGVTRSIEVAADIAIACAEYFPKSELMTAQAPSLAAHGIDVTREYAVFQCSSAARDHLVPIANELAVYAKQTGRQIVLLPLGPCHGDVETLQSIQGLADNAFCCLPTLSVLEMLAVIASAHVFVGVSMHGNICARSYGVRHGFGVLPSVDKIAGAMHILDMQPGQQMRQWDELCDFMLCLETLDATRMSEHSAQLGQQAAHALGEAVKCLIECKAEALTPAHIQTANDKHTRRVDGRNSPCSCGSGKRFKDCCGSLQARGPASRDQQRDETPALLRRALNAQIGGGLALAGALYSQVLEIQPDHVDALHMLGVVYLQEHNFRRAAPLIFRALELTDWAIAAMRHNLALTLAPLLRGLLADARPADTHPLQIVTPPVASAGDGPKVSVLIPSFNHARYIEDALRSVFAQSYRTIEIIVIDDGSGDESVSLIHAILKDSPFPYRFVSRDNRGAHVTLNECASMAGGKYLAPLNSDDVFARDRVAQMVSSLETTGLPWGFSRIECLDQRSRELLPEADPRVAELRNLQQELLASRPMSRVFWKCNPSISTGNLFMTRSLFETIGGFRDYRANHDWDFCLRASERSEPCFVDAALYRYRLHDSNTISESAERNRIEADQMLSGHMARAFDSSSVPTNVEALTYQNHRDEFVQCLFDAGVARLMPPTLFKQVVQDLVSMTAPGDTDVVTNGEATHVSQAVASV